MRWMKNHQVQLFGMEVCLDVNGQEDFAFENQIVNNHQWSKANLCENNMAHGHCLQYLNDGMEHGKVLNGEERQTQLNADECQSRRLPWELIAHGSDRGVDQSTLRDIICHANDTRTDLVAAPR